MSSVTPPSTPHRISCVAGAAQPIPRDRSPSPQRTSAIPLRTSIVLTVLLLSALASPVQGLTWHLDIEQGKTKSWNFPITNACTTTHDFTVKPPDEVSVQRGMPVTVGPGENISIGIILDATDLEPGRYSRQLEVLCDDCGQEPSCAQDRRVFDLEIKVVQGPCSCKKVTVRAGPARVTGSGGLVVDGVLTAELTRRFTFDLQCRGKKASGPEGTCFERVGVQATGLRVVVSDGTHSEILTPTNEETEDGEGIRLHCSCRRDGTCRSHERVDVVYRASLDVPAWTVDDLSADSPRRVDADIHATWQPVSETGFCDVATVEGFDNDTVDGKVLKIR